MKSCCLVVSSTASSIWVEGEPFAGDDGLAFERGEGLVFLEEDADEADEADEEEDGRWSRWGWRPESEAD